MPSGSGTISSATPKSSSGTTRVAKCPTRRTIWNCSTTRRGGQYYHADAYCSSVRDQYLPLTGFTYAELDTPAYKELEPCLTCQPPRAKSEIAKENLERGAITEEEYLAALTPHPLSG